VLIKINRNSPCPCGSGKKYKKCCLLTQSNERSSLASEVNEELSAFLSQFEGESLEQLQSLTDQFMHAKNDAPIDDFLGLSSEHVHQLLHPLSQDGQHQGSWYRIQDQLASEPSAPILMLVDAIAAAIGATQDKGLKATAKGNLPQKFCQTAFLEYSQEYLESSIYRYLKVNKEDDFFDLQVARIVMELAGLLRKTKGHFFLTQKYKKLTAHGDKKRLFPVLFTNYCFEFNWAYGDQYGDMPFIQQSALFSLYMLHSMGHVKQAQSIYVNTFLKAFPMVLNEVEYEYSYTTVEEQAQSCYASRVLKRFFWFMGLVSLEDPEGADQWESDQLIKKLALLEELVKFMPLQR